MKGDVHMETLWILFWAILFASFLLSIYCIYKKMFISGIVQLLLSAGFTYLSITVGTASRYSGRGIGEFSYFVERLLTLQLDALLILVCLILIVGFTIYHLIMLNSKNHQ